MHSSFVDFACLGGSVKAEGLGDGPLTCERGHRQAALDAATRPL